MPPWIHRGESVRETRFPLTFPGPLGASQEHCPPWLSLFDKWGMRWSLLMVGCRSGLQTVWQQPGWHGHRPGRVDKVLSQVEQGPQDRAHCCVLASNTQLLGPRRSTGETRAKRVCHSEAERLVKAQLLSTGGEIFQDLNQWSTCTGIYHAPAQLVWA